MTTHPIYTEALQARMRRAVATAEEDGCGAYIDPRDLTALLDAIQSGIDHRKFLIGRLRGAKHRADNHEARANAAEHRATRAEAQSAIRGRAVAYARERVREAEAERDAARGYISELETAVRSRNEVITHRDARIKAVRDVLDRHAHYGLVEADDLRRALDGDA